MSNEAVCRTAPATPGLLDIKANVNVNVCNSDAENANISDGVSDSVSVIRGYQVLYQGGFPLSNVGFPLSNVQGVFLEFVSFINMGGTFTHI